MVAFTIGLFSGAKTSIFNISTPNTQQFSCRKSDDFSSLLRGIKCLNFEYGCTTLKVEVAAFNYVGEGQKIRENKR